MGIAIEDIQQGIRDNNIHGNFWGVDNTPYWEGRVLSELALLTAGEEVVYAQALWFGDRSNSRAEFLALTESLVIKSFILDAAGADHTTLALPRRNLSQLGISAMGEFASGHGPGRVELRLRFEGWDGEVALPGRGDTTYLSTRDVGSLVAGLRIDLNS